MAAAATAAAAAMAAAEAEAKAAAEAEAEAAAEAAAGPCEWLYIDQESVVQGPFDQAELLEWLLGGYLPTELLVRPTNGSSSDYKPLAVHIGAGGVLEEPLKALTAALAAEAGAAAAAPPAPSAAAGDGACEWVYLDQDGNEQGPFAEGEIFEWLVGGYLPDNLSVRPAGEPSAQYAALEQVVGAGGALEQRMRAWIDAGNGGAAVGVT